METLLKLNSSRAGRDKLFRTAQYALKVVASFEGGGGSDGGGDTGRRLEQLLASFRRLLRFGTCADVLHSARTTLVYTDPMVRWTATLSRVAFSMYLLGDHLVWLATNKLMDVDAGKASRFSNRSWLAAILLRLLRDLYEIRQVLRRREHEQPWKKTLSAHKEVLSDTLVNACDVWVPAAALGLAPVPAWFVGATGVVSSLTSMLAILSPAYRLHPAG